MKIRINKREAAYALNADERSLTRWQNREVDPLPVTRRGRRGQANEYELRALIDWQLRQAVQEVHELPDGTVVNFEVAAARLMKARADAVQRRNEEWRQTYGPRWVLKQVIEAVTQAAAEKLAELPQEVRKHVPHLTATELRVIETVTGKARAALQNVRMPPE